MYIPFDKELIKDNKKRKILLILMIIFPLLFALGMYFLRTNNYSIYEVIGKEDHLIEWLQFFLFLSSGIISFIITFKFKKVSKVMFFVFLILSLGFIFVSGEEISWGERFFNIQSAEIFDGEAELPLLGENVQSEMNIHNFRTIHNIVGIIYLTIGFYACFMWLIVCISKKVASIKSEWKKYIPFFIPPPYLFFYFLPLGINLSPINRIGLAPQDYEMTEFLLSLGTFFFVLLCLKYFNNKFQKTEKRIIK